MSKIVDVPLVLDLESAVGIISNEKGVVLDREVVTRLCDKVQGILNEMGVVQQVISEAVDVALDEWDLETGLKPEELVVGEKYKVRDVPMLHHRVRNKIVEFVGFDESYGDKFPIVKDKKGTKYMVVCGSGGLKRVA